MRLFELIQPSQHMDQSQELLGSTLATSTLPKSSQPASGLSSQAFKLRKVQVRVTQSLVGIGASSLQMAWVDDKRRSFCQGQTESLGLERRGTLHRIVLSDSQGADPDQPVAFAAPIAAPGCIPHIIYVAFVCSELKGSASKAELSIPKPLDIPWMLQGPNRIDASADQPPPSSSGLTSRRLLAAGARMNPAMGFGLYRETLCFAARIEVSGPGRVATTADGPSRRPAQQTSALAGGEVGMRGTASDV
ncbi:hypothetical protein JHW43_000239 [Diplocarpon mali]|nr:hypothetical protein JHW43_000239 [Diplocarpon mali]